MRYDVASQDSRENELNDEEIGAERVATIVESGILVSLLFRGAG